jgi:hypothetical protein
LRQFIRRLPFLVFVLGLAVAVYVFLVVQVLQSYPFHHLGAFGDQPFLLLTYTETMEVALPVSMVAFAVWQHDRLRSRHQHWAAPRAIAKSLAVFGGLGAVTVYSEIHLVWGELWYGVHVWAGLLGGGGYPWGDEQVAYNLCFVREPTFTPSTPDCYFLNYNWLLVIAVAAFIVGAFISFYLRKDDLSLLPGRRVDEPGALGPTTSPTKPSENRASDLRQPTKK